MRGLGRTAGQGSPQPEGQKIRSWLTLRVTHCMRCGLAQDPVMEPRAHRQAPCPTEAALSRARDPTGQDTRFLGNGGTWGRNSRVDL